MAKFCSSLGIKSLIKSTIRRYPGSTNAFRIFDKILDLCWTKIVLLSLSPKAESFVDKQ